MTWRNAVGACFFSPNYLRKTWRHWMSTNINKSPVVKTVDIGNGMKKNEQRLLSGEPNICEIHWNQQSWTPKNHLLKSTKTTRTSEQIDPPTPISRNRPGCNSPRPAPRSLWPAARSRGRALRNRIGSGVNGAGSIEGFRCLMVGQMQTM